MPLVAAKCKNCGGNLNVNPENKTGICPYCKTPYITEEAINNYYVSHVYNIENLHAGKVTINNDESLETRLRNCEANLQLHEYLVARNEFEKLTKKFAYDYRTWLGLARVDSENFSNLNITRSTLDVIKDNYSKACKECLASQPDAIKLFKPNVDKYLSRVENNLTSKTNELTVITKQYSSACDDLRNRQVRAKESFDCQIYVENEKIKNRDKRFCLLSHVIGFGIIGIIVLMAIFEELSMLILIIPALLFHKFCCFIAEKFKDEANENTRLKIKECQAAREKSENEYNNKIYEYEKKKSAFQREINRLSN